ncbi:hypothetical protein F4604DRAFT_1883396 [Suillus subluteus]|nr:hypothetical protein F4604DRAFT_1883396 [Suillus subluteus]
MEYILALKNALLEDPIVKLGDDALERLHNPPKGPITIDSPGIRHSISMYLALEHASQTAYNRIMRSTMLNFAGADGVDDLLSFYKVERLVAGYTGVELIKHDMCLNSCLAFMGPFADLETCPINGHTKVAAQMFTTIPIGPQLQALYQHPDSAHDMRYLHNQVQEVLAGLAQTGEIPVFDDIVMGHDAIGAVLDRDIKEDDIVLMVSLDVIINLSPDKRYHKVHVHPGGFILGPNKLKNLDSFLVVGLHHLAALQNEGLVIWDSSCDVTFTSDLYLIFTTADGPGLIYWDGMPLGQCAPGSDHADISMFRLPPGGSQEYADNLRHLVSSLSQRQLEMRRTETSIMKPPLILGLNPSRCLGVPNCMTTDIMHLAGNLNCAATDDVTTWDWAVLHDVEAWSAHGELVAQSGLFLPEKLNTSYKTWEFQLYTFGLAPGLLYNILPDITIEHIQEAQTLLCNWEYEFELYHIHFIRPCIHQTNHLVAETICKGPPICYAQWTMERTIGNLGQEIHQPSRPYPNLLQEGLDEPSKGLPIGAIDSGDGFALLCKCDKYAFSPVGGAAQAILDYLGDGPALPHIKHWARLLLPNGQIPWSVWRETLKPLDLTRTSRNVKIKYHREVWFGEVLYFTGISVEAGLDDDCDWRWHDVALIQMYSHPDDDLLQLSSHTVTSCSHLEDICIVSVKQILSVIAMVPHKPILPSGVMDKEGQFFMLEKPGLDLSSIGIANVPADDKDNVPDIE